MSIKRVGRLRRQYEGYGLERRACSAGCGRLVDTYSEHCGAEKCIKYLQTTRRCTSCGGVSDGQ